MAKTGLLQALHLVKNYGKRQVVKDVSLQFSVGRVAGLLGPNGAGKTSCFHMIIGSVQHDSGHILLDGRDLTRLPMHQRARAGIGYLPQEASVFRKLTVADNISAILQLRRDLNRPQRLEKLEKLLNEFHIDHVRNSRGFSLSGGERRRVEIARALATEPTFILLDEPFAGVDPISIADIKAIIHHLTQSNVGVIITDHNVRETLDICDKAYIINEGTILAEGDARTILNNETVRRVYLGSSFRM